MGLTYSTSVHWCRVELTYSNWSVHWCVGGLPIPQVCIGEWTIEVCIGAEWSLPIPLELLQSGLGANFAFSIGVCKVSIDATQPRSHGLNTYLKPLLTEFLQVFHVRSWAAKVLPCYSPLVLLVSSPHVQAPKAAMAPKASSTMTQGQWLDILKVHAKQIERLAWKTMDYDQFIVDMIKLLKEVARLTLRLCEKQLARQMRHASLSLTSSECDLFTTKLCKSVSHLKKRLRDSGSGVRLPKCYTEIDRVWARSHGKSHRKESKEVNKKSSFGQEEGKEVQEQSKDDESKAEDKEEAGEEKRGEAEDIRSVFGLPAKELVKMNLLSPSSGSKSEVGLGALILMTAHLETHYQAQAKNFGILLNSHGHACSCEP